MAVTISRLSREYIFTDIKSEQDLTPSSVEVAFVPNAEALPQESDWNEATASPIPGVGVRVSILVGPEHQDAIDLSPTIEPFIDYQQWVRLTDNPERVVRRAGTVTVE